MKTGPMIIPDERAFARAVEGSIHGESTPRTPDETVFELHSEPDDDGRRRFTMHWYAPFFHTGPGLRAQVFFAELDPHVQKAVTRGPVRFTGACAPPWTYAKIDDDATASD